MNINNQQIDGMAEPDGRDQLVDLKEIAARLVVSKRSVWRLVASGDLVQPVKIGRLVRWFEADLQTYLDRKRQKRDSEYKALSRPRGES